MALKGSFLEVGAVNAGEADMRAIRAAGRSCNGNMSMLRTNHGGLARPTSSTNRVLGVIFMTNHVGVVVDKQSQQLLMWHYVI